jgi:hypothetical protein
MHSGMTKRTRILAFGFAAALVVAGAVAAAAVSGAFGQILAMGLIGLGFVLATSLAFLEVGLSEDRERTREEAARRARKEGPRERRRPSRLQRMRGRPRRLR